MNSLAKVSPWVQKLLEFCCFLVISKSLSSTQSRFIKWNHHASDQKSIQLICAEHRIICNGKCRFRNREICSLQLRVLAQKALLKERRGPNTGRPPVTRSC